LSLSHLFEDQTVHPFLDANFHVVSIDVGNWDRNLDVSQTYGDPIENGIPAVVILAGSGDVIASTKNGALADARTATAGRPLLPQDLGGSKARTCGSLAVTPH